MGQRSLTQMTMIPWWPLFFIACGPLGIRERQRRVQENAGREGDELMASPPFHGGGIQLSWQINRYAPIAIRLD